MGVRIICYQKYRQHANKETSSESGNCFSFHSEFKELPTLRKLIQVLTEIGFTGCIETLRTILREAGYEWSKIYDNCKALFVKHDVQMMRFT